MDPTGTARHALTGRGSANVCEACESFDVQCGCPHTHFMSQALVCPNAKEKRNHRCERHIQLTLVHGHLPAQKRMSATMMTFSNSWRVLVRSFTVGIPAEITRLQHKVCDSENSNAPVCNTAESTPRLWSGPFSTSCCDQQRKRYLMKV